MVSYGGYRSRRQRRNVWIILLVCLIGLELGGNLGIYVSQWESFSWAGVSLEMGTEDPWQVSTPLHDASILLRTRLNLGSFFGLMMSLVIYYLVRRR